MQGLAISNELLPFGSPLLALFCLVPLYISLYRATSYGESFLLFFVQTLGSHLVSSFWLANFHGFAVFTLGASALGTAFEGGLCGVAFHLLPSLATESGRLSERAGVYSRSVARSLCFAALFVLWEWVKSTGDLGYPWGTLSMAAYRWRVIVQVADLTGVWGVSFLFALANAAAAECARTPWPPLSAQRRSLPAGCRGLLRGTVALWALCALYGAVQYTIPRTVEKTVETVIVQQNIDPWEGGDEASLPISMALTEAKVQELRDEGRSVDLVLWSEGVLGMVFPQAYGYYKFSPEDESLRDFIDRMDVPFVIGGTVRMNRAKRRYANSALLFDRDGALAGFYSKRHLVPFAEQVPYGENPLMHFFMQHVVGFASPLISGKELVLFEIPLNGNGPEESPLEEGLGGLARIALDGSGRAAGDERLRYLSNNAPSRASRVRFTVPICFEDAFSDVCRPLFRAGSEVFFNITNDSWSKMPSAEYQHFIAASYLAVEYRTTLVRCANAGYSVVVGPDGRILADLPVFTEAALGVSVPVYEHRATVYARWGDWLPVLLLAAAGLYALSACLSFHLRSRQEKNGGALLTKHLKIAITVQL